MASRSRKATSICVWCVLLCSAVGTAAAPALSDPELQRRRAERRATARTANLQADKAAAPGRFGLLVIPVDFADARLPHTWDNRNLLARLQPDTGETLHNYFSIASGGRLDLGITVAPLVRLPEARLQYSDRDLNGFTRTRKLATEALLAVRDLGLEFRRLDMDGPDGIAGSGDDDGQVDGVLILHAGVGQENDPADGLIQALQFYLDEPVESAGITASFYAVASLGSGPGIWAHETAHLLGLEDRYDPILRPDGQSEVRSVGGLGRFSLMSSGAWGTGDGFGAALPDGYSAAQMGWYRVRNLVGTPVDSLTSALREGEVGRLWSRGSAGPEYFLLEVRDPVASAPFDADVPGGDLLVYHIDETLAEGNWSEDGLYEWHLRANVVEADADRGLATGMDEGRAEDLFPGPLGVTEWGPLTTPSTVGYFDGPSNVALTGIARAGAGVRFGVSLDTEPSFTFAAEFTGVALDQQLELTLRETGVALVAPTCELTATSPAGDGTFASTGTRIVTFALQQDSPGVWRPVVPVVWQLTGGLPVDSQTRFRYRFTDPAGTLGDETRTWIWLSSGQDLDFRSRWPGAWTVTHPDENFETTWHRWDGAPWLTAEREPVLACTGATFATPELWPTVNYQNRAHTALTSAPLGAPVKGVRLTHAIEVEMLTRLVAMDGGKVVWVGPDGREVPALPLGGYGGQIAPRAFNPLHGQEAFIAGELALQADVPLWRTDTFLVPETGSGPWRLRLVFAANTLWRARGWYIAAIEPVLDPDAEPDFATHWDGDLSWTWPWATTGGATFSVESRATADAPWQRIVGGDFYAEPDGRFRLAGTEVLAALHGSPRQRHEVRIVGERPVGQVAGSPVVVYPDGGDGQAVTLGQPWPNPSRGAVRFLLRVPAGRTGRLRIYDLRGRLVQDRQYGSGEQLVVWDGRADNGARVAAGIYYLRLEGTGPVLTRKVVLIH